MRMKMFFASLLALFLLLYLVMRLPTVTSYSIPTEPDAVDKGEYLVAAGGCVSCHESVSGDDSLGGGLALESEFGTFFAPNITPDLETGIGGWSGTDFVRALKYGRRPDGSFYFPAFPYSSYSEMSDEDALYIAAYLMSLPPVSASVQPHLTPFWLVRPLMAGWNLMASWVGSDLPVDLADLSADKRELLQRGEYLARHLGHCGECHTPRNTLGILDRSQEFKGATLLSGNVEAIDPIALESWTEEDFVFFLLLGLKPDGEYVGGEMESVIEHNTSRLNEFDRRALASFFKREL